LKDGKTPTLGAPVGRTQQIFYSRQGNVTRCGLSNEFVDSHVC